jgi:hypothetical protein
MAKIALLVAVGIISGGCFFAGSPRAPMPEQPKRAAGFEWQEGHGASDVTFNEVVRALHDHCRLNAPVTIHSQCPEDLYGYTSKHSGAFQIHLNVSMHFGYILETLAHEWAHCMVWDASRTPDTRGHDELWGVAYSRAYRVLESVLTAPLPNLVPGGPVAVEGGKLSNGQDKRTGARDGLGSVRVEGERVRACIRSAK